MPFNFQTFRILGLMQQMYSGSDFERLLIFIFCFSFKKDSKKMADQLVFFKKGMNFASNYNGELAFMWGFFLV